MKHRLWAQDRPHSSTGVEPTRLFGKVTAAAASLWVSAGSPVVRGASARLVLPPEFTASSPAAPWLPRFSERRQQSWEITRCYKPTSAQQDLTRHSGFWERRRKGGKVQSRDGKASQHHDLKPAVALPGLEARALVFSQRRGGQVELEVLVLEDTAGGRVTVGSAEQPVLFTAVAARQFCQES